MTLNHALSYWILNFLPYTRTVSYCDTICAPFGFPDSILDVRMFVLLCNLIDWIIEEGLELELELELF
jgi:hypothetical protein